MHLQYAKPTAWADYLGLLKKYCHHSNVTACAIEFTKTVGADLHVRPNVPSRTTITAPRHRVMVAVN